MSRFLKHAAGITRLPVALLLLAITLLAVAGCGTGTGTLQVQVLGSSGGLTGAKVVSGFQPDGQLKVTGLTGVDGRVTFTGVKTGSYEFTVSCAGYLPQDFSVKVVSGHREVTVTMAPQSQGSPYIPRGFIRMVPPVPADRAEVSG